MAAGGAILTKKNNSREKRLNCRVFTVILKNFYPQKCPENKQELSTLKRRVHTL